MNTQKVLLGALLAQPDLAPYSLPDLDVEHFAPDVQPVFAAVSVSYTHLTLPTNSLV